MKLIQIDIDFVDSSTNLHIKFNEIDPVIKYINEMDRALRMDYVLYHPAEGERAAQMLIQNRRLSMLDHRTFLNLDDIEMISDEIKGKYRKLYVVCFEEERAEI